MQTGCARRALLLAALSLTRRGAEAQTPPAARSDTQVIYLTSEAAPNAAKRFNVVPSEALFLIAGPLADEISSRLTRTGLFACSEEAFLDAGLSSGRCALPPSAEALITLSPLSAQDPPQLNASASYISHCGRHSPRSLVAQRVRQSWVWPDDDEQ